MIASASDLLQTKLAIPPARADLVFRPRLVEQLNQALSKPLTHVCAPAGYGKTTLIAEWLSSEVGGAVRVAWYSLDDDDNDPNRFLSYLVTTIAKVCDADLDDLFALLHSPQPPAAKAFVTAMLS